MFLKKKQEHGIYISFDEQNAIACKLTLIGVTAGEDGHVSSFGQ